MGMLIRRHRNVKKTVDFESLTLKELKLLAEEKEIKLPPKITKDEIILLLKGV